MQLHPQWPQSPIELAGRGLNRAVFDKRPRVEAAHKPGDVKGETAKEKAHRFAEMMVRNLNEADHPKLTI